MKSVHTLAAALCEMLPVEIKKIEAIKFHHMGDLGSAYEGLSEELSKMISVSLSSEIKIVSGQITSGGVVIPAQIDRMLVVGDGIEMGINSGKYQYDISQVLVVIESKKTLSKREIDFTFSHISKVSESFRQLNKKSKPAGRVKSIAYEMAKDVFDKKVLQKKYAETMSNFTLDYERPLMVCVSYSGYKTLSSMSEAYVSSLSRHLSSGGSFWDTPNIIICQDMCLIRDGFSSTVHASTNPGLGIQAAKVNGIDFLILSIWKKIVRAGLANNVFKYDHTLLGKAKHICWLPSNADGIGNIPPFTTMIDLIGRAGEKHFEECEIKPVEVNNAFLIFFLGSINYSGPNKGRMRYALDDYRQQMGLANYKDVMLAARSIPKLFDDNFMSFGLGGGFHFLRAAKGKVYFSRSLEALSIFCIDEGACGKVDSLYGIAVDEGTDSSATVFGHVEGRLEKCGEHTITKAFGGRLNIKVPGRTYKDIFNDRLEPTN